MARGYGLAMGKTGFYKTSHTYRLRYRNTVYGPVSLVGAIFCDSNPSNTKTEKFPWGHMG